MEDYTMTQAMCRRVSLTELQLFLSLEHAWLCSMRSGTALLAQQTAWLLCAVDVTAAMTYCTGVCVS